MKLDGNGFTFDSTGRQLRTYSSDNLSLFDGDTLCSGYDTMCDIFENGKEDFDCILSDEEKKEVAEYMIQQWKVYGGIES